MSNNYTIRKGWSVINLMSIMILHSNKVLIYQPYYKVSTYPQHIIN